MWYFTKSFIWQAKKFMMWWNILYIFGIVLTPHCFCAYRDERPGQNQQQTCKNTPPFYRAACYHMQLALPDPLSTLGQKHLHRVFFSHHCGAGLVTVQDRINRLHFLSRHNFMEPRREQERETPSNDFSLGWDMTNVGECFLIREGWSLHCCSEIWLMCTVTAGTEYIQGHPMCRTPQAQ